MVALDTHDSKAKIGYAGVDPHHYLHGKGFWEAGRMPSKSVAKGAV